MINERLRTAPSGWVALAVLLPVVVLTFLFLLRAAAAAAAGGVGSVIASVVVIAVDIVCLTGLFIVNPNQGRVLQLFGKWMRSARPTWSATSLSYCGVTGRRSRS